MGEIQTPPLIFQAKNFRKPHRTWTSVSSHTSSPTSSCATHSILATLAVLLFFQQCKIFFCLRDWLSLYFSLHLKSTSSQHLSLVTIIYYVNLHHIPFSNLLYLSWPDSIIINLFVYLNFIYLLHQNVSSMRAGTSPVVFRKLVESYSQQHPYYYYQFILSNSYVHTPWLS